MLQGYHIARLAADLQDFLQILDLKVRLQCHFTIQTTVPRTLIAMLPLDAA